MELLKEYQCGSLITVRCHRLLLLKVVMALFRPIPPVLLLLPQWPSAKLTELTHLLHFYYISDSSKLYLCVCPSVFMRVCTSVEPGCRLLHYLTFIFHNFIISPSLSCSLTSPNFSMFPSFLFIKMWH